MSCNTVLLISYHQLAQWLGHVDPMQMRHSNFTPKIDSVAQGMVFWRARLPLQQGLGLPTAETHTFIGNDMAAVFYPIANGQCVWTVGAPESKLAEAGIAARGPNRSSFKDAGSDGAVSAEQLEQQRAEAGKEIIEVHMTYTFCFKTQHRRPFSCHDGRLCMQPRAACCQANLLSMAGKVSAAPWIAWPQLILSWLSMPALVFEGCSRMDCNTSCWQQ